MILNNKINNVFRLSSMLLLSYLSYSTAFATPSKPPHPKPPQIAIDICQGKIVGTVCTLNTPEGKLKGLCKTPPRKSILICIPNNHKHNPPGKKK